MSKTVWTGSWEGVCAVSPNHRFHGDMMTPNKPGGASLTKACCGHPVKYEKKMVTVELDVSIKDDS